MTVKHAVGDLTSVATESAPGHAAFVRPPVATPAHPSAGHPLTAGARGPDYIIPRAYRLRGFLDGDALARALDVLVQRHEALRTTFAPFKGSPVQSIAARGMAFYRHDLEPVEADERASAGERLLRAEARRRPGSRRGPGLRAVLARLAPDDHMLLLAAPAAAVDEWSMRVLWRELGIAYVTERAGSTTPRTAPDQRLARVTPVARPAPARGPRAEGADWWRRVLLGADRLSLPDDGARNGSLTPRVETAAVRPGPQTAASLVKLASAERASLFMTLVAGYATLLARYTGQRQVTLGVPVTGRPGGDHEALVGPYTRLVPLPVAVAPRSSFRELVRATRGLALQAYEYAADLPEGSTWAIQGGATIVLSDERAPGPDFGDISAELIPMAPVEPTGRLSARFTLDGPTLSGTLSCRSAGSRAATSRLAGQLARLLDEVAANPDRTAASLPTIGAGERRHVLSLGRGHVVSFDEDVTPWALFDHAAGRAPAAVAVRCGDRSRTFCEVRAEALHVARLLGAQGVPVGARVGVVAADAVDLLPQLLGVAAAGGVGVPFDTGADARQFERAGIDLVLSGGRVSPSHPTVSSGVAPATGVRAVLIHGAGDDGGGPAVAISARNLANAVAWQRATFGIDGADVVWSRGDAVENLLVPLLAGAGVAMCPRGATSSEAAADLEASGATLARVGPADFARLLDAWAAGAAQPGAALRALIVRADRPPGEIAERFQRFARGAARSDLRLHVTLGSPATTFDVAHWSARPGDGPDVIGRPIANARLYVVDGAGGLAPLGMPGELWAGGAPVARPDSRAAGGIEPAFSGDPFTPGGAVFRTGHVARWTHDGVLQWIGRVTEPANNARSAPAGRVLGTR